MDDSEHCAGVMVIRVWLEGGSIRPLRARITRSVDITASDQTVTAAASVDEVCAQVRAWLLDFLSP